jgi:hypothetical protein
MEIQYFQVSSPTHRCFCAKSQACCHVLGLFALFIHNNATDTLSELDVYATEAMTHIF